jgi:hypothetical protein
VATVSADLVARAQKDMDYPAGRTRVSWNTPTRELPVIRPVRVLDTRFVSTPTVATRRTPADWPLYVWTPLLLAPGALAGGMAILVGHLVATLLP